MVINGQRLTAAESATVRVALESFASHLTERGLGTDRHGKRMTDLYLKRIDDIRLVLYKREERTYKATQGGETVQ